jgi:hypothetical protein
MVVHKHFCQNCSALVAEGDFDCGHAADHDLETCASCRAREKASADLDFCAHAELATMVFCGGFGAPSAFH